MDNSQGAFVQYIDEPPGPPLMIRLRNSVQVGVTRTHT